jgi:hypothetical protein
MIEQVEELASYLKRNLFCQFRGLQQRKIDVPQWLPHQTISPGVAKRAAGRKRLAESIRAKSERSTRLFNREIVVREPRLRQQSGSEPVPVGDYETGGTVNRSPVRVEEESIERIRGV